MIVSRTVALTDPLARANVADALRGPGGPAGVLDVSEAGHELAIRFDDAISPAELIDDLIAIESVFVPARSERELSTDEAAAMAAVGLADPELDGTRIVERYLDGVKR